MAVRNIAHEELKDKLMFAFGSQPDVRVFVRDVGFDFARKIKFGIKGEADIQGIWGPFGVALAIEVKTGSGRLSKDQVRWRDMFLKQGGIYIEARDVEQSLKYFESKKAEWMVNAYIKLLAIKKKPE